MTRIDDTFARLRAENKKAFVAYVMAGDPDEATSLDIVRALPGAGVDIIELGLPFTDPMADGPTIQLAGQRALEGVLASEIAAGIYGLDVLARDDAREMLAHMEALVCLVTECGVPVERNWSRNPGQLLYRDRWQVVAMPDRHSVH